MLRIIIAGSLILFVGMSSAMAGIMWTHAAIARTSAVTKSVDDAQKPRPAEAPKEVRQ
jgi:hypothetical protein